MIASEFRIVPKALFVPRLALPALVAFMIGYFVMGIVSATSEFRTRLRTPAAYVPSLGTGPDSLLGSASYQFNQIHFRLSNVPDVCWSNRAVNDFQRSQCATFWSYTMLDILVGTIPFAFAIAFILGAMALLRELYRRMHKAIQAGKADLSGVVTNPALAPGDPFSYWTCLRPVSVQLATKQQITVYMHLETAVPFPGQTLALFRIGNFFGSMRYVGFLYAPHLAVMKARG